MSECDDVPPLEDMSHAFKAVPAGTQSSIPASAPSSNSTLPTDQRPGSQDSGNKVSGGFGGMRSGFLVQKQKPRQHQTLPPPSSDSLPFIRSDPEAARSSLQLPEVQESLRSAAEGLADKSWITEDLLAKVESNPDLLRRLCDPRMTPALAKFQSDPAGAMHDFKDDPEVQGLLRDFAAILGDHFTSVAEKQEAGEVKKVQPTPQPAVVDPEVEEVLSRPGIREALMNSDVQRWLTLLKSEPMKAQGILRSSRDPEFQGRVRLLFENGLVGMAK